MPTLRPGGRDVTCVRVMRITSRGRLVAPPALDDLAVALVVRSEGEQLEAVRPGLERAGDRRRDAQRVERGRVDDLVVELRAPRAGEHDVDLLGVLVDVTERNALVGLDALMRDAGVRRLEVLAGEARLLDLAVAERLGGVLDVGELLERVGGGHRRPPVDRVSGQVLNAPLPAA